MIAGLAVVSLAIADPVASGLAGPDGAIQAILRCQAVQEASVKAQCFDAAGTELRAAMADRRPERRGNGAREVVERTQPSNCLSDKTDCPSPPDRERPQTSFIAGVLATGYGLFRIDLRDGSRWQTVESDRDLFLRSGDAIAISRRPLGGYVAKTRTNPAIRVTPAYRSR